MSNIVNDQIAEEIKDASWVLPRSMLCTIILNGATGLIMIITFCFCITDLQEVLASEAGFPFIQGKRTLTHYLEIVSLMTASLL